MKNQKTHLEVQPCDRRGGGGNLVGKSSVSFEETEAASDRAPEKQSHQHATKDDALSREFTKADSGTPRLALAM